MKYVYMSQLSPKKAFLSTNRSTAIRLAGSSGEVWRVPYGYSKDVHHHWDIPTFRLIGMRVR